MKKYLLLFILPTVIFAIWDLDSISVNHWRCKIENNGTWGYGVTGPGGYWPYPLKNFYIYGAGTWIGATIGPESLVTLGYNPNSGTSEMIPTLCQYWRAGYANALDRIYQYPGDWPPPLSRFPMAPQIPRSNMDLWSCFGDSDPVYHTSPGRPIGIDVALTVYGFSDTLTKDFFFLKYDLINSNAYSLDNLYMGIVMDGDIGDATDDMVGFIHDRYFTVGSQTIRVKNTGFMYDNNNLEPVSATWAGGTPGALAMRLLSAPAGLTLSAFKIFTLDIDPTGDNNQYLTLAGYNYQTGAYQPYDSVDLTPNDKRFLMSSGPLNLAPSATATFCYAVIAAPYGAAGAPATNRDTTQLAWQSYIADSIFQARILNIEETRPITYYKTLNIFPNPFKSYLQISSSSNRKLNIEIYNTNGSLVKTLSGNSLLIWNGKDDQNLILPSGVYFLKTTELSNPTTTKVLLIRD